MQRGGLSTSVEAFIQKVIDEFGRMDILVNNAGITRDGLLMKMSEEDFDQVIETNLKGAFHTIRFAARQMLSAEKRQDHQSVLCCRGDRKCRPGQLCGLQGRSHRTD